MLEPSDSVIWGGNVLRIWKYQAHVCSGNAHDNATCWGVVCVCAFTTCLPKRKFLALIRPERTPRERGGNADVSLVKQLQYVWFRPVFSQTALLLYLHSHTTSLHKPDSPLSQRRCQQQQERRVQLEPWRRMDINAATCDLHRQHTGIRGDVMCGVSEKPKQQKNK